MCSDFNLTVAAHGKHSHMQPLSAMYSNLEPNSGHAWEHFPCAAAVRFHTTVYVSYAYDWPQ